MNQITYLIANVAYLFVAALQLLMFIRAILSWIPLMEENAFTIFVYQITETVIYPVRCILDRFEFIAALPIDLSFFVTFVLLSVLQTVLL